MAEFSLQLNEDQVQIQKWVHGFAEEVLRPAAHEWDEREEFPFEIVQQAAEIGLYGWEFLMNTMSDQTARCAVISRALAGMSACMRSGKRPHTRYADAPNRSPRRSKASLT